MRYNSAYVDVVGEAKIITIFIVSPQASGFSS